MTWRARPDPAIAVTGTYSWESQARQFAHLGVPFLEHRVEHGGGGAPINCFLYRNLVGELIGILYHYPRNIYPYERAGNVNIWVRPGDQRTGIAGLLLDAAQRKVGEFNFRQQRYSTEGAAMINKYLAERKVTAR